MIPAYGEQLDLHRDQTIGHLEAWSRCTFFVANPCIGTGLEPTGVVAAGRRPCAWVSTPRGCGTPSIFGPSKAVASLEHLQSFHATRVQDGVKTQGSSGRNKRAEAQLACPKCRADAYVHAKHANLASSPSAVLRT